jgi:hypothetical protein
MPSKETAEPRRDYNLKAGKPGEMRWHLLPIPGFMAFSGF